MFKSMMEYFKLKIKNITAILEQLMEAEKKG